MGGIISVKLNMDTEIITRYLNRTKCHDEFLSMTMRVVIGKIGISLYFVLAYYS